MSEPDIEAERRAVAIVGEAKAARPASGSPSTMKVTDLILRPSVKRPRPRSARPLSSRDRRLERDERVAVLDRAIAGSGGADVSAEPANAGPASMRRQARCRMPTRTHVSWRFPYSPIQRLLHVLSRRPSWRAQWVNPAPALSPPRRSMGATAAQSAGSQGDFAMNRIVVARCLRRELLASVAKAQDVRPSESADIPAGKPNTG